MAEAPPFDLSTDPAGPRIVTALSKIGMALKAGTSPGNGDSNLTPTAAQALALLQRSGSHGREGLSDALGLTPAAADELIDGLRRMGLASGGSRHDSGTRSIQVTGRGREVAEATLAWPDLMLDAVEMLDAEEQAAFLVGLLKIIRQLQEQGRIPVARMCVTCRFFQPHLHDDPLLPHHCALVDAPFGDASLRIDCPEQDAAEPQRAALNWSRFDRREPDPSRQTPE
jgi:DNA-binding MarR family transcriptional regulator